MDMILEDIRGFKIRLKTMPGFFSKKRVDEGSKLLINNMRIKDGTLIADLGCGSGVIGIIAAKLNTRGKVHLLDLNLRIIELARANIKINEVKNAEVFLSDLFSAVDKITYDQILSNPPLHLGKEFLNETISECYKHLKFESSILLVVQKHLKPFIERILNTHFGNSNIVARGAKHIIMEAQKVN